MSASSKPVLALSGGVGGAKLALGLADVLEPGRLHVMVNTADDFEHLGLHISPDIDTLVYTLAGRANAEQGWGLEGETWQALAALEELGGDSWFKLGDRDLATHLWRSQQLAQGKKLSECTALMAGKLAITSHIYPMTDDAVRTTVTTPEGDLAFQHYFVRERCEPAVTGFRFEGISAAKASPQVLSRLEADAFSGVIICPSNPFVSVDPILQLPGFWQALRDAAATVIVVSPIVGGLALKGPAAKMMAELGMATTALAVAQHYSEQYPALVDHFVIDETDATLAPSIRELGINVTVAQTIMHKRADKQALAHVTANLAGVD